VNLGARLCAVFFGEEDVIVKSGVEGRIEVDEIDGLVLDVELEDFEVIAVVELVLFGAHGFRQNQRMIFLLAVLNVAAP
jgi:hypothetical protein